MMGLTQTEKYLRRLGDRLTALAAGTAISQPAFHIWPGYRQLRYEAHILFLVEDDETVRIVRILHQRVDHTAQLDE